MSPAIDSGELLIDGGIVNNFPVDIVKREYGCLTIGVSVSVHQELKVPEVEVPSIGAHLYRKYIQRAAGYRTVVVRKLADGLPPFDWDGTRLGGRMTFRYLPPAERAVASTRHRVFSTKAGLALVGLYRRGSGLRWRKTG
jgi:predicted acylesterase/phospholipase RssA